MGWMFNGATSYNQDLGAWADRFPYDGFAANIFAGSGCTFQDDPQLDERGPFCASSCAEMSSHNDEHAANYYFAEYRLRFFNKHTSSVKPKDSKTASNYNCSSTNNLQNPKPDPESSDGAIRFVPPSLVFFLGFCSFLITLCN